MRQRKTVRDRKREGGGSERGHCDIKADILIDRNKETNRENVSEKLRS